MRMLMRWLAHRFASMTVAIIATVSMTASIHAADSHLDKILAEKTLRVGTTGDYRPFTFFNAAERRFEGADVDLAADLAQSLGVELTLFKTSWPSLMDDLLADKFDIAMGGISVSLERQQRADFSDAYLTDGKAPIARCTDVEKYQTLKEIDRPGTRVIVNPGGTNERFAKSTLKQASLLIYPDNVTIFEEIVSGKADVMITDASETRFQQKMHAGILCATNPDHPFNFSEKAFLLPRDTIWKAYVNQWLHQALMTTRLRSILDSWLR